MNEKEQNEAFENLVDALARLCGDQTDNGARVLEMAAETLLELKTRDTLNAAVINLLEQLIARHVRERDHWKANHDQQVERARILIDRPDLPIERVRAYDYVCALAEEAAQLRDSNDALQQELNETRGKLGMLRKTLGVSASPHRSLFARMIEAARDVGVHS